MNILPSNFKNKILVFTVLLSLVFVVLFNNINTVRRILNSSAQTINELKAFPEAEGFGQYAKGGRGGKVIEVTNLNDNGSGSLRACIEASGPRTCVFRIGGTIETSSIMTIKNPYITIAGQSAPGDGITLKASPSYGKGSLAIRTHDVIIRHIRVRPGPSTGQTSERRGITVESSSSTNTPYNIILDHVSISWATDDNLTLIDGVRDFTIQWSIISEGLSNSTHSEGEHSKGMAISGKMYNSSVKTGNISVHHNLFAHNNDRNPRHAAWGLVDMVNNVIYNWGFNSFEANDGQTKVPANIVGNYFKAGVDSDAEEVLVDADEGHGAEIFVFDNIGPNRLSNSDPQHNIVESKSRGYIVPNRFDAPPITTTSPQDAYNAVLANAGARKPNVDSVDQRIVNSVINKTGRIIDNPSQVGGWPVLSTVSVDNDADNDGMDDPWEITHFGNTSRGSANDSSPDFDGDGYTDLEEFLNGTNPKISDTGSVILTPTPQVSPTPTQMTSPTRTPTPMQSPSPTRTPTPTVKLSATPTQLPSLTKTPTPTNKPGGTSTISPTSTISNSTAPTTIACTLRNQGDANCDNIIDLVDFVCWRGELNKQQPINCVSADFNNDSVVLSNDFVIWITTFKKSL